MDVWTGIILAAGEGSRLRLYCKLPKPAASIGRFRLLHFPVLSLSIAGVRSFIIVTRRVLRSFISKAISRLGVSYRVVLNDKTWRENGYSLYLGARLCEDDYFFVSMSDHIYPPSVPKKLLKDMDEDTDILVAADTNPQYVNVGEATKILAMGGFVLRIGKSIARYNYVDAGLFIMSRRIIPLLERMVARMDIIRVSDIVNMAVANGYVVRVSDITGMPWIDVDTPEDVNRVLYGEAVSLVRMLLKEAGGPI